MSKKANARRNHYIILFLIVIIVPFILKSPMSVIPVLFIVLSIFISLIYMILLKNTIDIQVDSRNVNEFTRLKVNEYYIQVINKFIFVFPKIIFKMDLESKEGYRVSSYEHQFILNPKEKEDLYLNINFPHIGEYRVTIKEIKIYSLFDSFYINKEVDWEEEIKVIPNIYKVNNLEIDTTNPIYAIDYNMPQKIEGGEFDDIREYEIGDPMKNIHWKISAHAGEYMTKVMKTDAVNGVSIYLDFKARENLNFLERAHINDGIIESAYSLGLEVLDGDYALNYIYSENNNPKNKLVKDALELKDLIDSMPRVSNKEDFNLELLFAQYLELQTFDNIIILTNNVDLDLINILGLMKDNGKYPKLGHIVMNKEVLSKELEESIKKKGIEYIREHSAKELIKKIGGDLDEIQ